MEREIEYFYLDAILTNDMTPEELEAELKKLKDESDQLTDWEPM